MTALTFFVVGTPAPQGSKRYLKPGVMVESSKRVAPWRADVRAAAEAALNGDPDAFLPLWDGPIDLNVVFYFPRPKSHYGTGRNAGTLKESAPLFHTQAPDCDKLARAVGDALTSVVFADDKTIIRWAATKRWGDAGGQPGARVVVDVMA